MTTDVIITRHPRARRLRLKVDRLTGQASLTVPPRVSGIQIADFLQTHQDWLKNRREQTLTPIPFVPGMALNILGNSVSIQHDALWRGKARISDDALIIGGQAAQFAKRTERALRALALEEFTAMAQALAEQLSLPPCPVRVKETRSRWGSCSVRTGINLSWRLIFAPREVARYVVAHEVAHRIHQNHGKAFWELVESLVGEPSPQRRWLAEHGPDLFRFRATPTVAALPPLAA